jgi:integrase
MIYIRLKVIHRRAGVPTDRRSMFHRMRRTSASWYKAKGGDPSQLLDHADPKTTARYLDLRICQTKSAAELLDDPTTARKIGGAQ